MEELMLTQTQVDMLKTMIEAYEKGSNVHLIFGMAAGKTTVGKIFNEYVRHKKENPSYKVSFTETGVNITFDILNKPVTNGSGTLIFEKQRESEDMFNFRLKMYDESGPIANSFIEEAKKRFKK